MKRGQSDRILPLAPVGQHRQCGIPQNWLPRLVLAGIGIAVSDRATRRPGFGFGTASPGRGLGSDRAWQKAKALIEDQKAAGADSKMTNAGISSTAPPTRRPSPVASLTRFSDISVRAKSDSVRTRLVNSFKRSITRSGIARRLMFKVLSLGRAFQEARQDKTGQDRSTKECHRLRSGEVTHRAHVLLSWLGWRSSGLFP